MRIIIFGISLKIIIHGYRILRKNIFLGDYTELKQDYLPHDYLQDASNYNV